MICDNCKREPWMGRPLHRAGRRKVCTDCFCFFSGIDPRDPAVERTARSGDDLYLTRHEWRAAGKPSIPVAPLSDTTVDLHVEDSSGWTPNRPDLAPLPKTAPLWARLLHWAGVRMLGER